MSSLTQSILLRFFIDALFYLFYLFLCYIIQNRTEHSTQTTEAMSCQTSPKPQLLYDFVSGFFSGADHRKGENSEVDWEYVDALDQDLPGFVSEEEDGDLPGFVSEEEDGELSEFGDQDFPSPSRFSSAKCRPARCLNCSRECHVPIDCDTVVKWASEIDAQLKNWLFATTRPCPLCQCLIHLNESSKYLICKDCNYKFCCDCGAQWPGRWNAWKYKVHICGSSRPAGFLVNDVLEREIAKSSLERFDQFYKGWEHYELYKEAALTELQLLKILHLPWICSILSLPKFELDFLVEAQVQIVEYHQLLKWMQVYGYFLTQDEQAKREPFQVMEGSAKQSLNLLDKHVKQVIEDIYSRELFVDCRKKLVKLTSVSRNYFNTVVEVLEAGLPVGVSIPRPMMLKEERSTGRSASPSMSIDTPNTLPKLEMQDCLTPFDKTSSSSNVIKVVEQHIQHAN